MDLSLSLSIQLNTNIYIFIPIFSSTIDIMLLSYLSSMYKFIQPDYRRD